MRDLLRRCRSAVAKLCRKTLAAALIASALTALLLQTLPHIPLTLPHIPLNPVSILTPSSAFGQTNSSRQDSMSAAAAKEGINSYHNMPILIGPEKRAVAAKEGINGCNMPNSTRPEDPLWTLSPDESLLYAKREIEHAPFIDDDPELYAPAFRNLSVFKRGYELMERILKVYIYPDGPKPIFRTPELRGIYASEGWFMKLMMESRKFSVSDPNRAHLFYLPYSSRRLRDALYTPDSHDLKPLAIFLRDYVNAISSKYPFWNRTRGSDHFLVACHDWGPYSTKLHPELLKNSIKALCNADTSEGVFIHGKDVSLPETLVRSPRKRRRRPPARHHSNRPILAFYAGLLHGRVRPVLEKMWGNATDGDMRIFRRLPFGAKSYDEHMSSSRFCLCPMGYEVNSPRIVEAISHGCVPVIIADNFVLPFDEFLNWPAFSMVVPEARIHDLRLILSSISPRQYARMQGCVRRVQRHFLWNPVPQPYDLFHLILHSLWLGRLNQLR